MVFFQRSLLCHIWCVVCHFVRFLLHSHTKIHYLSASIVHKLIGFLLWFLLLSQDIVVHRCVFMVTFRLFFCAFFVFCNWLYFFRWLREFFFPWWPNRLYYIHCTVLWYNVWLKIKFKYPITSFMEYVLTNHSNHFFLLIILKLVKF